MKTVDQTNGQHIGLTKAQNTSSRDEPNVPDINSGQNEEDNIQEAKIIQTVKSPQNTVQEDQTSRVSQDDNYHTAIDDDDLDDTVQFGHLVMNFFCQGASEYQQQR